MTLTNTYQAIIAAPFGCVIGIRMNGMAVDALDYLPIGIVEKSPANTAAAQAAEELKAYFHNPRSPFTILRAPQGTAFQQRVWAALQTIPPGTVLTYSELAQQLDTAARPIGGACRSNPLPILIPCHRVVGRQGLGGYAGEVTGDLLGIKRWLLRHEGVDCSGA
ncbi:MAG TPA: cysteine methyltransferase [Gammaproteobacteria bacterium]|nr:cysteine methyltransferase [Gammaproteobacteria bacterium]HRF44580.1 methylated-DNA--[protein]-cysteine S-methyltransferase [Candidatus Competibacteraceae bacterium]